MSFSRRDPIPEGSTYQYRALLTDVDGDPVENVAQLTEIFLTWADASTTPPTPILP